MTEPDEPTRTELVDSAELYHLRRSAVLIDTRALQAAAGASGWLDPPNPAHSCYEEMPTPLSREDWRRRWRCSCGAVWRVRDSQRAGYYFGADTDAD